MDRVRELVHTKDTHELGYTGRGIRIALPDTGVAVHPDLRGKVVAFCDFVNGKERMYDDNGHGTHIAGILCGNGAASQSHVNNPPLGRNPYEKEEASFGKYFGMAPDAQLVVCKILDKYGNGKTQTALEALRWVGKHREAYGIRLLNFSMGYLPDVRSREQKELLDAVDRLWNAGIAVVTAAGNNGPKRGSVTVPGISRNVITVGASDDDGDLTESEQRNQCDADYGDRQTYGEKQMHSDKQVHGDKHMWENGYSGRGPTDCCIVKPEILAPGTNIRSLDAHTGRYTVKSGTSMAVPVVCGALALALEKDPELSPVLLKLALYESVDREPAQLFQNCWGLLNVDRLLGML